MPSAKTKQGAIYELQERKGGVKDRLKESIKSLSFDLSELNDACLPCNDEFGIKWGNI